MAAPPRLASTEEHDHHLVMKAIHHWRNNLLSDVLHMWKCETANSSTVMKDASYFSANPPATNLLVSSVPSQQTSVDTLTQMERKRIKVSPLAGCLSFTNLDLWTEK